ncbi:helix-turn-helix domain-containing protein [Saccharopolyspora hattusasensis]|uniref:helix-turn-helix domain-containing protein n=1 Tax=Saccharopolyspora hattusasensis TaxID=1128679 RepID=UPI003D97DD42
MSPLAEGLRSAREAAGLSREQVAIHIGRSWQAVRGYERGMWTPPLDRLQALAALYGVTLDDLVNGKPGVSPDAA